MSGENHPWRRSNHAKKRLRNHKLHEPGCLTCPHCDGTNYLKIAWRTFLCACGFVFTQ